MLPPSPRRLRLGRDLRRLQDAVGLSNTALGLRIGVSSATVSRVASGLRLPTVPEIRAWADACEADAATIERLLADREDAYTETETWRHALASGDRLEARAAQLETARLVRSFCMNVIPGLLQTADYARALIEADGGRDVDAAVAQRMERQHALYEPGRDFRFLIADAALRLPVAPVEAMRAQLHRLTTFVGVPQVTLGVVPASGDVVPMNDFGIYTGDETIVHIELYHGDVTLARPEDVAVYEELWERLTAAAITGQGAAELINSVLEGR